jgi:hypothetical protein
MDGYSPLALLGILWGAITVVLVALVIYRAIVGIHEDDQLFLARAGAAPEKEQTRTLKRIRVLDAWIKRFIIVSGFLLLILAGIWFYQGFYGPASL